MSGKVNTEEFAFGNNRYHGVVQEMVAYRNHKKYNPNLNEVEELRIKIQNEIQELGGLEAIEDYINRTGNKFTKPSEIQELDLTDFK